MDGYVIIAFVVTLAAVLLWSGIADQRRRAAKLRAELKASYGKLSKKVMALERYNEVRSYYLRHKKDFQIDDITWNDLDMDDIYHAMDITRSSAGEEYLYYVLRTPAMDPSGIHFSQAQLAFPDNDEEVRLRLQTILSGLGHTGRFSIYEYLDFFDEMKASPAWIHLVSAALPFAACSQPDLPPALWLELRAEQPASAGGPLPLPDAFHSRRPGRLRSFVDGTTALRGQARSQTAMDNDGLRA